MQPKQRSLLMLQMFRPVLHVPSSEPRATSPAVSSVAALLRKASAWGRARVSASDQPTVFAFDPRLQRWVEHGGEAGSSLPPPPMLATHGSTGAAQEGTDSDAATGTALSQLWRRGKGIRNRYVDVFTHAPACEQHAALLPMQSETAALAPSTFFTPLELCPAGGDCTSPKRGKAGPVDSDQMPGEHLQVTQARALLLRQACC